MEASIIIPTANRRPEKLARAIRSVLGQEQGEHDSVEIIVSNNSDRPLPDTVNALAAQNGVHVVDSAGKRGVSYARNEGARTARFSLLAFLDDDDWWEPTFLAATGSPVVAGEADLALCGFWKWPASGPRREGKLAQFPITVDSLYARNPGFRGSNSVIRREVFEALGGFDETLTTSNDRDFLIRFLRRDYRLQVVT
ncbi:MAG: glycosyltransferase family 2 protein, partial [Lentisphaerae bacterium]|nr:glycosyltransferase family 2 protein [Lentisphaerota bacterium]